jgi:predicted alpha/beta-hydrolase family hydrolase
VTTELSFVASEEKGYVDAVLIKPKKPVAVLVLAHGAGANLRHAHMTNIAEALAAVGIATLRFNFPYMQQGKPRTDNIPTCIETFTNAIRLTRKKIRSVPLFIGGHSFGGRMSSHYMAETADDRVTGLLYFSFPLHNAKKPATKRADHLPTIQKPMLFLSGTRDGLADLSLLKPIVQTLVNGQLHELDTADHSFKILKRTRQAAEDVYTEAARVTADWMTKIILKE